MVLGVKFADIVPYTSVFLDCSISDIIFGIQKCIVTPSSTNQEERNRMNLVQDLQHFFVTEANPAPALCCLSVRTAFDLFLRSSAFPPDSEIIFSAINIPDMSYIAQQYGLKVVPCDIELDTLGPRVDLLEELITSETVAIVVAHLFGRWFDMEPVIALAQRWNLKVIEDCAEAFCGFDRLGHRLSDIVLFSFGPIKFYTSFGGCIAKIRDRGLFERISVAHERYPMQPAGVYLAKLLKCAGVFVLLNIPRFIKPGMFVADKLSIDHKKHVVNMLRGFPQDLLRRLRHRPPIALLALLLRRLETFEDDAFKKASNNGRYIWDRLPQEVLKFGSQSCLNHFWLFPILVNDPVIVARELNRNGIDAYIGASQLNIVEPEFVVFNSSQSDISSKDTRIFISPYPRTARFFMDHVVYLPVNKKVPGDYLERMSLVLERVISSVCDRKPELPSNDDLFIAKI